LSDSFEAYYQCIRRSWRFGQKKPVNVNIVLTEFEREIFDNVISKEKEAVKMSESLIKNVQQYEKAELDGIFINGWEYKENTVNGDAWVLMQGDCVERIKEVKDESIDMSVFSPPFIDLYSYSPTERDIGNSKNKQDYENHFNFLIPELLRVTKEGRICAVHVADVPAMMVRDGYIGMKDFSGDVIRMFEKHGWIFDARIPIDKNQQAQSIRTHTKALTMTQFEKDRSWLRPALPDYILKFRKPGENKVLVDNKEITRNNWIEWANPTWPNEDRCAEMGSYATWYGIRESDTLQGWAAGKWHKRNGGEDEKHICPLQLGTIERCIRLWSNSGETVLSPFMGIGSEGYQAILFGRKFVGIELKPEYFAEAKKNVELAWSRKYSDDLFTPEKEAV
jgi:DNA modification methylase